VYLTVIKDDYDKDNQFQQDTVPQLGHDHLLAYISGDLFVNQHIIRRRAVRRTANYLKMMP
jgi:hypothetical protein